MRIPFQDKAPVTGDNVFIAPGAAVIGDVTLNDDASVWYGAVLRGDVQPIRVGDRTNVQDGAIVHATTGRTPTTIGNDVTIGHRAIVHGCTVGDRVLVGMGAIILDDAVIEPDCIIGAGALVTSGTHIPARSLVIGSPARVKRTLSEAEVASLLDSAAHYVETAAAHMASIAAHEDPHG